MIQKGKKVERWVEGSHENVLCILFSGATNGSCEERLLTSSVILEKALELKIIIK